ncbi:MAG: SapC family protein [Woeseiaceae bacterium]|nr:SapC family protein [Woeseiaceae bacterium]
MKQLVELDSETHRNCRVAENCALQFATAQHMMPIHAAEAGQAVCNFPVFFSRSPNTGRWALSAVTSLEVGRNLFVEDGQWTATYVPTGMQTYPLFLMQSPTEENKYTVGVIGHDNVLSQEAGEALFDGNGNASIYLSQVTKLLEAGIENEVQTRLFAQRLDELDLLKPINVNVHYDDGSIHTNTGLHTINEDKLQAMSPEQLGELNTKGYLLLVHAMLVSIFQLNSLVRKHNQVAGSRPVKQVKLEIARDIATAEPRL